MSTYRTLLTTDQIESDCLPSGDGGISDEMQVQSPGCGQKFWSIANPQHVTPEWNRRKLLPVVLPLLAMIFLLFHACRDLNCHEWVPKNFVLWLDCGLVLMFLMVRVLPTYSVCVDAFVIASLLAYTLFHRSSVQDTLPFELLWTALLSQVGVRSGLVFFYGSISCCYISMLDTSLGIFSLSYVVVVVSGAFSIDYNVAAMSAELRKSKSALARLLEHASSGFCKVDPRTGVIQTASDSLQRTLRMESLQGASLVDFIKESHAPEISKMYTTSARDAIKPALVTCHIREPQGSALQFEAKVIPFISSEDNLEIAFQAHSLAERIPAGNESSYFLSSTTGEVSWDVTPDFSAFQRLVNCGVQTHVTDPLNGCQRSAIASHPSGVPALPRPAQHKNRISSSNTSDRSSSSGGSRRRGPKGRKKSSCGSHLDVKMDVGGDVSPFLQTFNATPILTCIKSARQLFKHWNLPKSSTCCPWHAAVDVVIALLKNVRKSECEPLWSPLCGWQCEKCRAMNKDDASRCKLCNKHHPSVSCRNNANEEFSAAVDEILSNADYE